MMSVHLTPGGISDPELFDVSRRAIMGRHRHDGTGSGSDMKANAAIARLLKREGVEYLFCYPSNTLIEACAVEGIRPLLARTERTVLAMADGYTRMHNGKKIGVCCFQRAFGSENMFGGVAQVFSDNTPILVLPGGNRRTEQGIPYAFDAKDHYRNTTKWVESI